MYSVTRCMRSTYTSRLLGVFIAIATCAASVENHLRAAKYRQGPAGLLVRDDGIPHLGGLAAMHRRGEADYRAVSCGTKMIGLQLDGGKAGGVRRKIGHAAVSRQGVRERDDGTRVQIAIGRHDGLHHRQFAADACRADFRDEDAKMTRQLAGACLVERLRRTHSHKFRTHALSYGIWSKKSTTPVSSEYSAPTTIKPAF